QVLRGGLEVLHHIDLTVAAGSITGLLGPSGSGKTTLMRCIVGAQVVAAGSVTIAGLTAGSRDLRARVGYVTQAPSIYPDLTVRENIAYFAALLRTPRSIIDSVIDDVGLTDIADRTVATLSGGQQSRASLGAALVGRPEVLILDEPTVGLDPVLRGELWEMFRRMADAGVTLVVSSHVMDEARRCDDLVFMRDGHVLAHDTLEGMKAHTGTTDAESAFLALASEVGDA
ncbi:MAG: ABC transporter ATP-binding protein, partial [Demequina sp.]